MIYVCFFIFPNTNWMRHHQFNFTFFNNNYVPQKKELKRKFDKSA